MEYREKVLPYVCMATSNFSAVLRTIILIKNCATLNLSQMYWDNKMLLQVLVSISFMQSC